MKTTEELLPCPNDCKHGLVNVFEYPSGNPEESRDLYQVACACGVRGPMKDSRKAAVAAWNALPRRSDIERIERERDWLAVNLANGLVDPGCIEHLAELGGMSPPDPATLIDAAKEATA